MGTVVFGSATVAACTEGTARHALALHRVGRLLAFGAVLLQGASHAVFELVRTLPALLVEGIVIICLALLAAIPILAKHASAYQLRAVLAEEVRVHSVLVLATRAMVGRLTGDAVG